MGCFSISCGAGLYTFPSSGPFPFNILIGLSFLYSFTDSTDELHLLLVKSNSCLSGQESQVSLPESGVIWWVQGEASWKMVTIANNETLLHFQHERSWAFYWPLENMSISLRLYITLCSTLHRLCESKIINGQLIFIYFSFSCTKNNHMNQIHL